MRALVLESRPHLFPDKLGYLVADVLVEEDLAEAGQPQLERAVLVAFLQDVAALFGRAL